MGSEGLVFHEVLVSTVSLCVDLSGDVIIMCGLSFLQKGACSSVCVGGIIITEPGIGISHLEG